MVSITPEDQQASRRITSPLDRLSFIVPLLSGAGSDDEPFPNGNGTDGEAPTNRFGRLMKGLLACSGAVVVGTGLSLTSCSLMSTDASVLTTKFSDPTVLRGMGLKHNPKTWNDYTEEMVNYISSHSYAALASGPLTTSLDPLIAVSFSHFPTREHGALGALLPNDVQHWADVHWTIAYTQFLDAYGLADQYHDEVTLLQRFEQYRKNGELVYQHNKRSIDYAVDPEEVDYLYTLELNRFADLSPEDMKAFGYVNPTLSGRQKPPKPEDADVQAQRYTDTLGYNLASAAVPDEFNWKGEGCVQKVKNQLRCGSCWAFSATEALESAVCVARKHKKGLLTSPIRRVISDFSPGPVSPDVDPSSDVHQDWTVAPEMPNLSEQQLVDCAQKDGNHGCSGGMMEFAFQYVMENSAGELCEEDSYGYEGKEGVCRETKCKYERDWKVTSWNNVTRFSASSLQRAIMTFGVIAVSVEADNPMFMMYKGGVVHDGKAGSDEADKSCGTALNHGVAVVGWGTDEETGEPYWMVKNSWGPNWGEDGFIRLARDSGGMFGECGILMDASYPIVKAYTHPTH